MCILVSGSTGFVGTSLVKTLQGQGHTIVPLARPGTARKDAAAGVHDKVHGEAVAWDPVAGQFDAAGAEGGCTHPSGGASTSTGAGTPRKELLCTSRDRGDAAPDRSAQAIAAAATRDRGGIGYRPHGRSRRGNPHGVQRAGNRFSTGDLPRVGSGIGPRRTIRRARGEPAVWNHTGGPRRRAAANGIALQTGRGRKAGQRPSVDVLITLWKRSASSNLP